LISSNLKLNNANRVSIYGELSLASLHPNACLKKIRNVQSGIKARTKILQTLEKTPSTAPKIATETSLSYGVVIHHLRLLQNEDIVDGKGGRPLHWALTGFGQKRLAP